MINIIFLHFLQPYPWYSPYISAIHPRSGEADGLITIYGKFFTDAYGSNFGEASNGREQKILRFVCSLHYILYIYVFIIYHN